MNQFVQLTVIGGPIGAFSKVETYTLSNIPSPQQIGQIAEIHIFVRVKYLGISNGPNIASFFFRLKKTILSPDGLVDMMDPDTLNFDLDKSRLFDLKDADDANSYFDWDDLDDLIVEIFGSVFTSGPGQVGLRFFNMWADVKRWQEVEPTQYPLFGGYDSIAVWAHSFRADVIAVDRLTETFGADVIVVDPPTPSLYVLSRSGIMHPIVSNSAVMSRLHSKSTIMHPVISHSSVMHPIVSHSSKMHPIVSREGKAIQ